MFLYTNISLLCSLTFFRESNYRVCLRPSPCPKPWMGSLKVWCIRFVVVFWNTWNRNLNYLWTQIIHIIRHKIFVVSLQMEIYWKSNQLQHCNKVMVIKLNEFFNQLPRRCLQPFVFRYSLSKWTLYSKNVYIVAWHQLYDPIQFLPLHS